MELQQAFNLISQVCGSFRGNLEDHNNIQQALIAVKKELFSKPDVPIIMEEDSRK